MHPRTPLRPRNSFRALARFGSSELEWQTLHFVFNRVDGQRPLQMLKRVARGVMIMFVSFAAVYTPSAAQLHEDDGR